MKRWDFDLKIDDIERDNDMPGYIYLDYDNLNCKRMANSLLEAGKIDDVDEVGEYFNECAELVSDDSSACETWQGRFDVHIDMTYELKVGVEVYHAHYEDDWDNVPDSWPDWAKQLAEENEKLGEYYRDLDKDKETQEKFDFALRNFSDLSKVNWKLAMK